MSTKQSKVCITFYLFYKPKQEFRKHYFAYWNGPNAYFTDLKSKAKRYNSEQEAQRDVIWLWEAKSSMAITLNIKIEKVKE
ncbi:MAG: hypothetical protein L0K62_00110 [Lactobacillus sp.]|nr:hypothetical protein [Lactobacillus sp.]MDN6663160.1 hypothetical protein [Tetragenococcus koreensis]